MLYRGEKLALAEFLPLEAANWITCGNALRLDWLSICPPSGTGVKLHAEDLFSTPLDQPEIDFENEGGETYICGNPPYKGSQWQTAEQKADLQAVFEGRTKNWGSLDYVAGWFLKAAEYGTLEQIPLPPSFLQIQSAKGGRSRPFGLYYLRRTTTLYFAAQSFKWANLASHKAGVTVVIVGISMHAAAARKLFTVDYDGTVTSREVPYINAYLVPAENVIVKKTSTPLFGVSEMIIR